MLRGPGATVGGCFWAHPTLQYRPDLRNRQWGHLGLLPPPQPCSNGVRGHTEQGPSHVPAMWTHRLLTQSFLESSGKVKEGCVEQGSLLF